MFNRTEMYFTGYSLVTTTLLLRFNIERRCNRSRTTVNQPSTQSLIAIVSTAVLCHIWSPWVKRCRQSRDLKKKLGELRHSSLGWGCLPLRTRRYHEVFCRWWLNGISAVERMVLSRPVFQGHTKSWSKPTRGSIGYL